MDTKTNPTDVTNEVLLTRLARVEGQVRGVSRMLDEGKYCTDIIDQITAARRALDRVALLVMRRHLNSCLKEGLAAGRREEMINELVDSIDKFLR